MLAKALAAFGVACLLVYGIATFRTWRYQREARSEVEQMVHVEKRTPEFVGA